MKIKGKCNICGRCCVCRIYTIPDQSEDIPPVMGWCEHLDQDTHKCKLQKNKPRGCKEFPTVDNFIRGEVPEGCGYYLDQ